MNEVSLTTSEASLTQPSFEYSRFVSEKIRQNKTTFANSDDLIIVNALITKGPDGINRATFITAPNTLWGRTIRWSLGNSINRKIIQEAVALYAGRCNMHRSSYKVGQIHKWLLTVTAKKIAAGKIATANYVTNLHKELVEALNEGIVKNENFKNTTTDFIQRQQSDRITSDVKKGLCKKLLEKHAEVQTAWKRGYTTYQIYHQHRLSCNKTVPYDAERAHVEYKVLQHNAQTLLNTAQAAAEAFKNRVTESPDEDFDGEYVRLIALLFDKAAEASSTCIWLAEHAGISDAKHQSELNQIQKLKEEWCYNELPNEDLRAIAIASSNISTATELPLTAPSAAPSAPDDQEIYDLANAQWVDTQLVKAQIIGTDLPPL